MGLGERERNPMRGANQNLIKKKKPTRKLKFNLNNLTMSYFWSCMSSARTSVRSLGTLYDAASIFQAKIISIVKPRDLVCAQGENASTNELSKELREG